MRLEGNEDFDETWAADHPCYGHNPEDIMPFHNLFLEDTIGEQEHEEEDHTNGEVSLVVFVFFVLQKGAAPGAVSYNLLCWTGVIPRDGQRMFRGRFGCFSVLPGPCPLLRSVSRGSRSKIYEMCPKACFRPQQHHCAYALARCKETCSS